MRATTDMVGYESRDTRTSLSMGGGNVVINGLWKLVVLAAYAGLYELTPLRMPADVWWTYVPLFFADDLAYYWFHRVHHEVRVFWASHVVHHSSQHYNLSTALRQTWTPMTALPFWAPLALLGFALDDPHPAGDQPHLPVLDPHRAGQEAAGARFEFFFNTPSHHRVHHGANEVYLDRNYGGILIIWDRIFGTFQGETERVRYGLTQNIRTFRPHRVAFHEFIAMGRDVRGASSWRDKLGFLFRGPGWSPDGTAAAPAAESPPPPPPPPTAAGAGGSTRLRLHVEQAAVEAVGAAVPELDQVGVEAPPAPARGATAAAPARRVVGRLLQRRRVRQRLALARGDGRRLCVTPAARRRSRPTPPRSASSPVPRP